VEIDFARRLWGQDAAALYHEYLYVVNGKRMNEDMFYTLFKGFSDKYFKCRIGVRGYRQMIVTVARAYLGTEYELELEEEDDALIRQRGHGPLADRRCYGVQSQYLSTLSSDLMFRFGHISEWWWRLTCFAPGKPPLLPLDLRRKAFDYDHDHYTPIGPVAGDAISSASSQVPHLSEERLAAIISASITTAVQELKKDMENVVQTRVAAGIAEVLSRQTSLQFPISRQSSTSTISPIETAGSSFSTQSFSSNTMVSDSMDVDAHPAPDLTPLQYLQKFYPHIAAPKFRSKAQEEMVNLAFSGTQNFVGILPTGGGKSLVFLLPAFADSIMPSSDGKIKKTLVIVPNKALLTDTLRKAQEFNIPCAQWTVGTDPRVTSNCSLILLAIETLASNRFQQYVFFFKSC
jgi:hypothetical protein